MQEIDLEQQQIELITSGQQARPVLIGTSIKKTPVEPSQKKPVIDVEAWKKARRKWDAEQKKIACGALRLDQFGDDYKHDVLHPDKYLHGSAWSERLNAAFIVGAIQSEREVQLVTTRKFYQDMGSGLLNNGTFWELLALKRCGYVFHLGDDNRIIISRDNKIADNYKEIVATVFAECQTVMNIISKGHYDFEGDDILQKYVQKYAPDIQALIGKDLLPRAPIDASDSTAVQTSAPQSVQKVDVLEQGQVSKPAGNNRRQSMIGSVITGMVVVTAVLAGFFRRTSETFNAADENSATLTPNPNLANTQEVLDSNALVQSMQAVKAEIAELSETQGSSSTPKVFSPSFTPRAPKASVVLPRSNMKTTDLLGVADSLHMRLLQSSKPEKEVNEIQQRFLEHIQIVEHRLSILKASAIKNRLSGELERAQTGLQLVNEIVNKGQKMPTKTEDTHSPRL